MGAIYIGGNRKESKGGSAKLYFYLIIFVFITGAILKFSAPMIVEEWINRKGKGEAGYAFSIRDVDISFARGELALKDLKVFNPKTNAKMFEVPDFKVQIDWTELVLSQTKNFSVVADKVDLVLSKDFSSELTRIQSINGKNDFYLDGVVAKVAILNVIEQKEDQSRTVLELKDVDVKAKELSLLSVNKKTEFNISSSVADGGKLTLKGKTIEENAWSLQGTFSQVPTDLFNKMAGVKLPFTFNESRLNADIIAETEDGTLSGEITPEIRKLNLLDEKPGIPTQVIARLLTDELTFVLPFTLKDELTLQYGETFRRLKSYRKGPAPAAVQATPVKISQKAKPEEKSSFWPF